ncbi:hypothetical protein [Mesorhizobium sp.]|uniref:hypothetical protein n=1 Tax=Mesorhizobium sp. TaxID=1871066 RepID=UPI00257FA507|nr:hypothetical protein [Mesorhizobium sp.]
MFAHLDLLAAPEMDRHDVTGSVAAEAMMPAPDASVTKICMPAIMRFSAPFSDFRPMVMVEFFHKRMWCSK